MLCMLSVVNKLLILSVIIVIVVMLNIIMLNVVAKLLILIPIACHEFLVLKGDKEEREAERNPLWLG
jgi:hypothetical protein